jgi:hypothetical protein
MRSPERSRVLPFVADETSLGYPAEACRNVRLSIRIPVKKAACKMPVLLFGFRGSMRCFSPRELV